MAYLRTFEAVSAGEAELDLYGYSCDIEVVADPSCNRAYVEVYTDASSGPSVDTINALPDPHGRILRVRLPQAAGFAGMAVSSAGAVQFGNGNTQTNHFGGHGGIVNAFGISGDADMYVGGQHVQVKNGRTFVNGVDVTDVGGSSENRSDPPMPINMRATVPYGSVVKAETYSGDIRIERALLVELKSYSGDITATGLAGDSRLKSYSGNLTVGAASGLRPEVHAETYSGDIRVLDDNVRLRPKTYSGDIRYPR